MSHYYTPAQRSWRGVYWLHLVCLSICGQNHVRSVSSTILVGSISYLHILSSNFRRCVARKIWNFGKYFKFLTLTLSCFDLRSNMNQLGNHGAVGRYPQNTDVLVVLVGSGNGLVSPGNKSLPEPALTMMPYVVTKPQWVNSQVPQDWTLITQISRFMGPIWGQQDPGGPHVGPMNFAIWVYVIFFYLFKRCKICSKYWFDTMTVIHNSKSPKISSIKNTL